MSSRAADLLDGYDTNYKNLQYDYVKSDAELPLRVLIFRKALYVIQICMVVGAGLVIMGAMIAQRNAFQFDYLPFGTMEDELIFVPFACGGVACFAAIVGCIGAKTRSKCALVIYLCTVGTALCLAIAGCAQAFADSGNIYNYTLRQWRALTNAQIIQFQTAHRCCNFDTLTPCCRFAPGQGECSNTEVCFDQVTDALQEDFQLIKWTCFVQSIYLFIVTLLAAVLCKWIDRNPKRFGITKDEQNISTNLNDDYNTKGGKDDDEFFS